MRWLISIAILMAVVVDHSWASSVEALRYLPVQDAGRVKPYDTFAREALELVFGKTKFKGKEAFEVVTTWMVVPEVWEKTEFMEVRHSGVREALKLDNRRIHYTPNELMTNERLPLVLQELRGQREKGEKLNPYFQEVQRLENQLTIFQAVRSGMAVHLIPQTDQDAWLSIDKLPDDLKGKFGVVMSKFVQAINAENPVAEIRAPVTVEQARLEMDQAVTEFITAARAVAPDRYANDFAIRLEVHYNRFHPFRWAWVGYLLAAIAFVAALVSSRSRWDMLAWTAMAVGFFLHTYGMGVRSYLSGRPPVSNMYETVVWVPWGTVLFAAILYRSGKNRLLMIAAAVVSILCLILTDLAPTVLDDSLHPLEPVLRSTFWLTTHVLIITISYAAFFLAFAMGDYLLFLYLRDENKHATAIAAGVHAIYRSIQIGVVLLAAGTILGGVWAAYSWGRFWGWDPKETWAFIALMGYLALLHGRLAGIVKNFGMAAGAVVSFSLVIMAWYGVNFVLGAGLHSYGFGAGGVEWVSGFVGIHLIYVAFVATVRQSRLAEKSSK